MATSCCHIEICDRLLQNFDRLFQNCEAGTHGRFWNFWETVESIWERNKNLSAEEAQALADEAVAQVHADRRRVP